MNEKAPSAQFWGHGVQLMLLLKERRNTTRKIDI